MKVEKFGSPGGQVTGVLGVALAGFTLLGLADNGLHGNEVPGVWALAFGATVLFASFFRPQLQLTEQTLTMRNMLDTVTVPLTALERIQVRRMVRVYAGGQRIVSTAVSDSVRDVFRGRANLRKGEMVYGTFVEERVRGLADAARARAGLKVGDFNGEVSRTWAWPVIAVLAISAVGFVAALIF